MDQNNVDRLYEDFREEIKGEKWQFNVDQCNDYVRKTFSENGAEPTPYVYHPFVPSDRGINAAFTKSEQMQRILYKISDIVEGDDNLLQALNIDEKIAELIRVNPGYSNYIPICRFDGFLIGDKYTFCEFNTDGTSGIVNLSIFDNAFLRTDAGRTLQKKYQLERFLIKPQLYKTLMYSYKKWGGKKDKPNLAIIDYSDMATNYEFNALCTFFRKKGLPCEICDIRKLEFKEDGLWHNNYKIDLIYRRAVTDEIIRRYDEIGDFIKAYKAGAVCVVGPVKSHIAHTKKLFTMICSGKMNKYLDEKEINFIKEVIPWTALLTGDLHNLDEILCNKNKYFLKPDDLNGGYGVISGEESSDEEWKKEIGDIIERGADNIIVQEKLEIPYAEMQYSSEESCNFNINAATYLFNNEASGFYVRVSPGKVINTQFGASVVPVFRGTNL